jgi:predicted DsbA family dithiol-disulfide isomerase
VATLVEIGAAAGLDASLIADLLAGDADREIVDNQASQAREMGISGVPTMVFDRKVTVVGAQPVDALRAAAARADKREPRATSF